MSNATISVESLIKEHPELNLELVSGEKGLDKKISNTEINRP